MNLTSVQVDILKKKARRNIAVMVRRRVNWFRYLVKKSAGKKDSYLSTNRRTMLTNMLIFMNIMGLNFAEAEAVCKEHYEDDVFDEREDLKKHGYVFS